MRLNRVARHVTAADPTRARFPLTCEYLGEAFLDDHLARGGNADSFLEHVNKRFSGGLISDRAARDIARYEAELTRLAARPALRAPAEPLPTDDVKLRLSDELCLLMYGADLPGMLAALREGKPAVARPRRAWILMIPRGGGKVDVKELGRDEGWLMEWFRDPTPIEDVLEMAEEREPFEQLWKRGILVRA